MNYNLLFYSVFFFKKMCISVLIFLKFLKKYIKILEKRQNKKCKYSDNTLNFDNFKMISSPNFVSIIMIMNYNLLSTLVFFKKMSVLFLIFLKILKKYIKILEKRQNKKCKYSDITLNFDNFKMISSLFLSMSSRL